VVPDGLVEVGSPFVTPTFPAGWHGGKPDKGGSAPRTLGLQEARHDVGPMESESTGHSRRSPTTSATVGR